MTTYTTSPHRHTIRELPLTEQPLVRLQQVGAEALSSSELVAAVLQTPDALALARIAGSKQQTAGGGTSAVGRWSR